MIDKKEIAERKESLSDLLSPGDTIYTSLKHVSRSGMYRVIDTFVMRDNKPLRISYGVSIVINHRYDRKHDGIGASGCGMDMGFEIVYNIGRCLFPEGFGCIGEHCPSNDHSNGDRDYTQNASIYHGMPQEKEYKTHWHKDGGYAFKHNWL